MDAATDINDKLILAARLLLVPLFLIFGWRKLRDYSGTVSQIVQLRVPMPAAAAAVAIFMELPVALAVAVGAFARPSALLMLFYTLGTALIGHRYWIITGVDRVASMDGFYKNLSIMGGFLLLYVTGGGKYSIDALCSMAALRLWRGPSSYQRIRPMRASSSAPIKPGRAGRVTTSEDRTEAFTIDPPDC